MLQVVLFQGLLEQRGFFRVDESTGVCIGVKPEIEGFGGGLPGQGLGVPDGQAFPRGRHCFVELLPLLSLVFQELLVLLLSLFQRLFVLFFHELVVLFDYCFFLLELLENERIL